jgi:hypothetical protein
MMSKKYDKTKTASSQNQKALPRGDDVENLLNQYDNGLKKYHEINHQDSIYEIRSRWPLLKEISNSATGIKRQK